MNVLELRAVLAMVEDIPEDRQASITQFAIAEALVGIFETMQQNASASSFLIDQSKALDAHVRQTLADAVAKL